MSLRAFLWENIGQVLFAYTPHNAYKYRTALLKRFGMKCGIRVRVRRSVVIDKPWNVEVDDLVMFGDGAIVNAGEKITIGKRTTISQYAMLITVSGTTESGGKLDVRKEIKIEDDCWVASDAVVLPGSVIEEGVVVGARGCVDGRLPKWKICTGEPAVPRGDRVLYGTT